MQIDTATTPGHVDETAVDNFLHYDDPSALSDAALFDDSHFSELEDLVWDRPGWRVPGWDAMQKDPRRSLLTALVIVMVLVGAVLVTIGLPVPDRPTISATEDEPTEESLVGQADAEPAPLLVAVPEGSEAAPQALASNEGLAEDAAADGTAGAAADGTAMKDAEDGATGTAAPADGSNPVAETGTAAAAEAETEMPDSEMTDSETPAPSTENAEPQPETAAAPTSSADRPISVPGMSALGNVKLRTNKGAYRFRAEQTGNIENLRLYFIANTHRPGYADGTGGTVRVTVAPDNGSGQPDPSKTFGGTFDVKFNLRDGAPTGDRRTFINDVLLGKHTFSQPIPVEAGKNYFIIFDNIDADPNANNVSLDLVYDLIPKDERPGQPVPSPARRTDIGFHQQASGGAWRDADVHRDGHWVTPIFEVTYANGFSQGQGFMQWQDEGAFTLAGSSAIRTLITLPADRTVSELSARVKGHASGSVVVELTDGQGTVLRSSTQRANGRVNLRGAVWVTANVDPITLKAGEQYALVIRAANGYSGSVVPLQAGSLYGFTAPSLFPFGKAQTSSNGSSWNDWGRLYPSIAIK